MAYIYAGGTTWYSLSLNCIVLLRVDSINRVSFKTSTTKPTIVQSRTLWQYLSLNRFKVCDPVRFPHDCMVEHGMCGWSSDRDSGDRSVGELRHCSFTAFYLPGSSTVTTCRSTPSTALASSTAERSHSSCTQGAQESKEVAAVRVKIAPCGLRNRGRQPQPLLDIAIQGQNHWEEK